MSAFCISLLSNLFTQGLREASKFRWPFVDELWPCSRSRVTAHLMQVFTVVDLFSRFSTSMINLAIRDDSNASGNESSATAGRWSPYTSYDVIMHDIIAGHENIYVNNSLQNPGRAVIEVALCLSRQDTSTDMQYDLTGSFIRSGRLTWLNVKF